MAAGNLRERILERIVDCSDATIAKVQRAIEANPELESVILDIAVSAFEEGDSYGFYDALWPSS